MTCPHDLADQDTASHWDGLCPLCLQEEVDRLRGIEVLYQAGVDAWNPVYKVVLDERDALRRRVAALEAELEARNAQALHQG